MTFARPIEFEYGRGRNMNVVKLLDQAQDQLFKKGDLAGRAKALMPRSRLTRLSGRRYSFARKCSMEQHRYQAAVPDCEAATSKQDSSVVEAALVRARANFFLHRYAVEHERDRALHHDSSASGRIWLALTRPARSCGCIVPIRRFEIAQKAVSDATTACKLMAWSDGESIDVLAAAEAATGNFDAAIKHEQQAMGATKVREDEKRDYQKHRRPISAAQAGFRHGALKSSRPL